MQPRPCPASIDDAIAERYDHISVSVTLVSTSGVCSRIDRLRVVVPIVRLECCNPSPIVLLLDPVLGLEKIELAVVCSKRVIPWLVRPSTKQARPLDHEQVFFVPAELKINHALFLLDHSTPSI